jgi:ribosomal-protein-alanine N-acetyltransferase
MRIVWSELVALTPGDVTPYAAALAAAYNDPKNSALLGNTQAMSVADVIEHYATLPYPFVLLADGELAGDADLRGVAGGAAEFAFLIAAPSAQGKGLGTRFATMIHAAAFRTLGLERVYASVIPDNTASLRVFEKLGYVPDETLAYGDPGDIVLRLDRAAFVEPSGITIQP